MGPNYTVVKFCSGLFFILAFGHGAVLKSEGHREEDLALSPDDVCPCIVRAECPREFGAKPEDKLLGYIPPCVDPGLVRCCGVSIEHSVSSNVRKSNDGKKTGSKAVAGPALPPSIVVPVPLQFPTDIDTGSSTDLPKYEDEGDSYYDYYDNESDEAITDVRKDQAAVEEQKIIFESSTVKIPCEKSTEGELNSLKILKGENIDGIISQTDAPVSPDHLDYRGVNKYDVKGGVQTITGSEQRGDIFSTKRVESDKRAEIIVNNEDSYSDHGRATETMHELAQELEEEKLSELRPEFFKHKTVSSESTTDSKTSTNERQDDVTRQSSHSQNSIVYEKLNSAEVDYSIEKIEPAVSRPAHRLDNERINNSKSGSRRKMGFKNHQETSSQQESDKVNLESSNFEESSSSSVVVQGNEQQEEVETIGKTAVKSRIPTITIRELETAINSRGKTEHKNRTLVSNQQRTQSVIKESVNVEEYSLSNDESVAKTTEEQSSVGTTANFSGRRRRPVSTLQKITSNLGTETALGSRSRVTWGQRKEISSQHQSEFLKRKHSNFEENASSDARNSTSVKTEGQLDQDLQNTEISTTTSRPVSEIRRLALNRGRIFNAQRKRISSQQQNEPVKMESTNFDQTTASSVQTVTSSTVELSHGETSSERLRTGSIAESIHRQHEEAISTHEISETVAKGSSNFTESTSFNANQAAVNQETTSSVVSAANINEANQNQSSGIDQETVSGSLDNVTVNVEQQTGTSSNQQSEVVSSESANSQKETVSSTSNLLSLVTGKQSLEGEVISKLAETDMNREVDPNALLVENRTYVPVLINTVFLRDRAIADLRIASDPVSTVTLSDVGKTELAPLLLLLRCGKVVFSDDFKQGKTLVCDVPEDDVSIRFLRDNDTAVISGKLDAVMADAAESHRETMRSESENSKEALISSNTENHSVANSLKTNSLVSESYGEESSTVTTVEAVKNVRQIALANRVSTNSLSSGSRSEGSSEVLKTVEAAENDHQLSLANTMTRDSFASESYSEKSSATTTTVEAPKHDRQITVGRRVRFRRPIQVPVPEERSEKEAEALPKPTRRTYRGRIRHRTFGRQALPGVERIRTVERDQAVVGSRQLMKESVSTFVQESESSTNSNQAVVATAPDFEVATTEEYGGVKETAVRNSRSYIPPPAAPILSRPQNDSPEATEGRAIPASDRRVPEAPEIVEVFAEAPATQTKFGKKKTSDFSIEKKLSSKDLELAKIRTSENNAANVEARELVGPAENSETPPFVYNRNNRQIVKFAPEKKAVTISPEDLSMTGRINVVGLIPKGFKDPALDTEDELAIDLPKISFRPSPVDPINWP